jgi:hypothetical protein
MTDDPDLAKLARDFMDLWQEQIAAAATDPALAKWTEAWMSSFSAAIGATGRDGGAGAPGAAALGAASDDVFRRLDEFAGRLDACEGRLAALERRARPKGGPDPDRDRGRRR